MYVRERMYLCVFAVPFNFRKLFYQLNSASIISFTSLSRIANYFVQYVAEMNYAWRIIAKFEEDLVINRTTDFIGRFEFWFALSILVWKTEDGTS